MYAIYFLNAYLPFSVYRAVFHYIFSFDNFVIIIQHAAWIWKYRYWIHRNRMLNRGLRRTDVIKITSQLS